MRTWLRVVAFLAFAGFIMVAGSGCASHGAKKASPTNTAGTETAANLRGGATPEEALARAFRAVEKNDAEELIECLRPQEAGEIGDPKQRGCFSIIDMLMQMYRELADAKLGPIVIEGDRAHAPILGWPTQRSRLAPGRSKWKRVVMLKDKGRWFIFLVESEGEKLPTGPEETRQPTER